MKHLIEKFLKTDYKHQGRLLKLKVDTVLTPGGREATREVVEHPGAVAVVAITEDKEIVFVRQYRQPVGEIVLEIPAGVPNKSETGEAAAKRELEEETGYRAGRIRKLFDGYTSPGYSNEILQFFLAEELQLVKAHPDEDEYVEVDLIDIEAAVDLVHAGKINDNKTVIGILWASLLPSSPDPFSQGERGGRAL